jgi:hypothetical protein
MLQLAALSTQEPEGAAQARQASAQNCCMKPLCWVVLQKPAFAHCPQLSLQEAMVELVAVAEASVVEEISLAAWEV